MLKHIAETIGEQKRAEDVLGRIGGEEFVLLVIDPNVDPMNAAERLREHVATSSFVYGGKTLAATVSGGLAIYPADGNDWDALLRWPTGGCMNQNGPDAIASPALNFVPYESAFPRPQSLPPLGAAG